MYWIHLNEVEDLDKLKKDLTVWPDVHVGESEPIKTYKIDNDCIGVPRAWGLKNIAKHYHDITKYPDFEWPEIKIEYWPGQEEAVKQIVETFGGCTNPCYGAMLQAKTGSGKTLMSLDIASRLGTNAIVIVHKTDLADQWRDTINKFWPEAKVGLIKQDKLDYKDNHVTIASAQTLYSRLYTLPIELWNYFGIAIYDEGHRYPARTFEKVLGAFNCRFRFACSATFRRKDNTECIWKWHVGEIEASAKTEHEVGEFCQLTWTTNISQDHFRIGPRINHSQLVNFIANNKARNGYIAKAVLKAMELGRNVIIMSDRVQHCKKLKSLIEAETDRTVALYLGETPKEQLKKAKEADCIIGTYGMFSEGTDVKKLDTLFLVTPRSDVEQAVGRIQRKFEKKSLMVVDIVDSMPYTRVLGNKRLKIYRKLGFQKYRKEEK